MITLLNLIFRRERSSLLVLELTNISTSNVTAGIKINTDKFSLKKDVWKINKVKYFTYKSGGVIIFDCFSISKCFQNGVGFEQLLFKFSLKIQFMRVVEWILKSPSKTNKWDNLTKIQQLFKHDEYYSYSGGTQGETKTLGCHPKILTLINCRSYLRTCSSSSPCKHKIYSLWCKAWHNDCYHISDTLFPYQGYVPFSTVQLLHKIVIAIRWPMSFLSTRYRSSSIKIMLAFKRWEGVTKSGPDLTP